MRALVLLSNSFEIVIWINPLPGGNNTEVDMVDSTQMEKFEFDKSNQTYLGKNNNNKDY